MAWNNFIYFILYSFVKSIRPSTEPCGSPWSSVCEEDSLVIWTNKDLLDKRDWNQHNAFPLMSSVIGVILKANAKKNKLNKDQQFLKLLYLIIHLPALYGG